MFGRKPKGPQSYSQWTDALAAPLTVGHAEYLRLGTLKQKSLYSAVFNRLSDYVTDTLDAEIGLLGRCYDTLGAVYELRRFGGALKRLFFFAALDFIDKRDSAALAEAVRASALRAIARFVPADGALDPELEFEIGAVKRILTSEAK